MGSVVVLVFLAASGILLLSAASASSAPPPARLLPCDAVGRGRLIELVCVGAPKNRGGECCTQLFQAARRGGLGCLCQAAATRGLVDSGYTVGDVLRWYSDCGGAANCQCDRRRRLPAPTTESSQQVRYILPPLISFCL